MTIPANHTPVEEIAEAILYEGYILFPYRQSAIKNQQRWTFGGVYPKAFSEASAGEESPLMQTECLVKGDDETRLDVKVRFLHVAERKIGRHVGEGIEFVEEMKVGDRTHRAWEEAIEREVSVEGLSIGELLDHARRFEINIPEGSDEERIADENRGDGDRSGVGVLVREWRSLSGEVEVYAERVSKGLFRLTVRIVNATEWDGEARGDAMKHTFVSTHTILRVDSGGEFVSLLETPEEYSGAAEGCENIKTWPVLAGEGKGAVLSSPIILYDYPEISPESPGNLFDGSEIDELLTLSILVMTDDEKRAMRESDPRAKEILERTESLSQEELMRLHGTMRDIRGGT